MNLPDWLPKEAWDGWLEMRGKKRWILTDRAKRIALRQLEGWHKEGYDVGHILDESTMKCWRGLFVNERTPRVQPAMREPSPEFSRKVLERLARAKQLGVDVDTVH